MEVAARTAHSAPAFLSWSWPTCLRTIKPITGTVIASVVGGTASEIGGRKFSNGAVTGAFGYLFNYCAHNGCTPTDFGDVRGRDRFGRGDYGVSRDGGARIHEGADFITTPGQDIQAPIDDVVTRVVYPYQDTRQLSSLEITLPSDRRICQDSLSNGCS